MLPIPLLSGVLNGIFGIFNKHQERKKIETKGKIKRIQNADDSLAEWEKIQAEASTSSWKDEYWTIILSIPCAMCFIPPFAPYAREGFSVLQTMPEYYRYWLGIAILASFGVRFTKR